MDFYVFRKGSICLPFITLQPALALYTITKSMNSQRLRLNVDDCGIFEQISIGAIKGLLLLCAVFVTKDLLLINIKFDFV